MKRFSVMIFFLVGASLAHESFYIIGMRNSKYAYAGINFFQNWEVAYENSLFIQNAELQHGRIALIYAFDAPLRLSGSYAFFYGMRYNFDYYDFGAVLDLKCRLFSKYLQIESVLQPFYDSDAKSMIGYSISARTMPIEEIGFFGGFKNLPEIRDIERRYFLGIIFETLRLKVMPEVSTPVVEDNRATTRVSVSFAYKNIL